MFRPRLMPCLLLKDNGLVKSVKFKNHRYIGDPLNAVKIFNEKKADELVFLDITAGEEKRHINFDLAAELGEECLMPFAVGGGIKDLPTIKTLLKLGAEKVVLNSVLFDKLELLTEASGQFGVQSAVACIDVKKSLLGKYSVYKDGGKTNTGLNPIEWAKKIEAAGAGEIIIQSIDQDGVMKGYDFQLVQSVAEAVNIPVVALGGAGNYEDFRKAVKECGASAAAAGSRFIYHGKLNGVLINFPANDELQKIFSD